MSTPYDCGHTNEEDHDDYCGVGACIVCMVQFERHGVYPHGVLMKAERTLEVRVKGFEKLGPLFRGSVCGDCGMVLALDGYETGGATVEVFW